MTPWSNDTLVSQVHLGADFDVQLNSYGGMAQLRKVDPLTHGTESYQ